MFVRIMIYSLFICSIYQNSLTQQQRNYNYSIQGLNKINRNPIENKDANNQRNNTQIFIEKSPWWLNLKHNRTDMPTATGIPTVKEIELFGRKDARRGRSYYAEHSTSESKNKIYPPLLQLILVGCLSLVYWLNNKLFI